MSPTSKPSMPCSRPGMIFWAPWRYSIGPRSPEASMMLPWSSFRVYSIPTTVSLATRMGLGQKTYAGIKPKQGESASNLDRREGAFWLSFHPAAGAVAQLVERVVRNDEAVSSNLIGSTRREFNQAAGFSSLSASSDLRTPPVIFSIFSKASEPWATPRASTSRPCGRTRSS